MHSSREDCVSAIENFFRVYIGSSKQERDISCNFRRTFGIFLQDLRRFTGETPSCTWRFTNVGFDFYNANTEYYWFLCCEMRVLIG